MRTAGCPNGEAYEVGIGRKVNRSFVQPAWGSLLDSAIVSRIIRASSQGLEPGIKGDGFIRTIERIRATDGETKQRRAL